MRSLSFLLAIFFASVALKCRLTISFLFFIFSVRSAVLLAQLLETHVFLLFSVKSRSIVVDFLFSYPLLKIYLVNNLLKSRLPLWIFLLFKKFAHQPSPFIPHIKTYGIGICGLGISIFHSSYNGREIFKAPAIILSFLCGFYILTQISNEIENKNDLQQKLAAVFCLVARITSSISFQCSKTSLVVWCLVWQYAVARICLNFRFQLIECILCVYRSISGVARILQWSLSPREGVLKPKERLLSLEIVVKHPRVLPPFRLRLWEWLD